MEQTEENKLVLSGESFEDTYSNIMDEYWDVFDTMMSE
jgi:hypothetical protein